MQHRRRRTMEELRQELLSEMIRQSVIAAELDAAGFQRICSPLPPHSGSSSEPRRLLKDRIEERSRSPSWHRAAAEEEDDASLGRARLHTNVLSGVKRKRTYRENIEDLRSEKKIVAKPSEENAPELAEKNLKPMSIWKCTICNSNYSSKSSHLRGRRHQENIEALRSKKKIEAKQLEGKAPLLHENNLKPVSRWKCTICNANCTSESDLESHLLGRRHQEKIEAPRNKRKIEAKHFEWKALHENNLKLVSRWNCTICNSYCSSKSDWENHFRGRRHQDNQDNIEAMRNEKKIEAKQLKWKAPLLHENNLKPVSRWNCTICKANCSSESDLESHLRGRRHQLNLQAQY